MIGDNKIAYLAQPYSHPDPEVMCARFKLACLVVADYLYKGQLVFSPIAHSHPVNMFAGGLLTGFEHWSKLDLKMIDLCDYLYIMEIEGWRESVGVTAEVEYARERRKVIKFISPDQKFLYECGIKIASFKSKEEK